MKTYKISKAAQKEDFLREGFKYSNYNELTMTKNLFKQVVSMSVSVDFTEEEPSVYVHVFYAESHASYPLNCDYGVNLVRESIKKKLDDEMLKLEVAGLLYEENNYNKENEKHKPGRKKCQK